MKILQHSTSVGIKWPVVTGRGTLILKGNRLVFILQCISIFRIILQFANLIFEKASS